MTLVSVGNESYNRKTVKQIKQFVEDPFWYEISDNIELKYLQEAQVIRFKDGLEYNRVDDKWKDAGTATARVLPKEAILDWIYTTPDLWVSRRDYKNAISLQQAREIVEDVTTVPFKYDEERLLKEFNDYVASTYSKHYVGEDNVQSLDLIFATGHGEGFCCGNILKYGARQGKKAGQQRDDIMKTLHYGLLLLYWYDKNKVNKNGKV